jgi:hypothetical protein
MKLKEIKICSYTIVLIFSFFSCRKIASDVIPPEFKQKLVINAFVSPDKQDNDVFVSSNIKRFGEVTGYYEPFGNISLFIQENSKEILFDTLRRDYNGTGYNFFIKNFQFKEGMTYDLKVVSDLGLEAEATCKIPEKRDFKIMVDTSYRKTTDEHGSNISILTAKIRIADPPGEANYYRILYLYEVYWPDGSVFRGTERNDWQNDHVKSDAGQDGEKFVLRSIEFQPEYLDHPVTRDSAFLRIYLLSTDKPYYDFHKSLENFSLGDAPFTEPSFIYSNVKGGLGIFASYVLDSLIYRIK